jgi:hypothetical protein
MSLFKNSKTILNHPAVEECLDAKSEGFEEYKYDVWLKEGWVFSNGRMKECRGGRFNTVEDFLFAAPTR